VLRAPSDVSRGPGEWWSGELVQRIYSPGENGRNNGATIPIAFLFSSCHRLSFFLAFFFAVAFFGGAAAVGLTRNSCWE
jgi:hypothetical protein